MIRRWRYGLLPVVIGAVALITAGCVPTIVHSTVTVVAEPGSGVDLLLLSGDGNFVVVHTPSGYERIDRRDHTSVALPLQTPTAISHDGSRVLLARNTASTPPAVWSNGQVLTPPDFPASNRTTHMSRDLTYGVFVDSDGKVKTWQTATQTVTDVETNFPRPPGTTTVYAYDVSNDGQTVEYNLRGTSEFRRFVSLETGQVFDAPIPYGVDKLFTLAPSGTAFVEFTAGSEQTARLVALPSGTVLRQYTAASGYFLWGGLNLISDSGRVAWVYEVAGYICSPEGAPPVFCITDAHAVWITSFGWRRIHTGVGDPYFDAFALSSDGRFLLFETHTRDGGGLFGAVDMWNQVEGLGYSYRFGSDVLVVNAHISDDDKLIATSTGSGGWYEFTP